MSVGENVLQSILPAPVERGLGSGRLVHGSRRDRLGVELSQEAVGRAVVCGLEPTKPLVRGVV
jgi:hypothetical protein